MLKLMPQERFNELWALQDTPACEEGMKLTHAFLDQCGEAIDETLEAELDAARFGFNRKWRDYTRDWLMCIHCLQWRQHGRREGRLLLRKL